MPDEVKARIELVSELISKSPWEKRGDLCVRWAKSVMDDKQERFVEQIKEEISCQK